MGLDNTLPINIPKSQQIKIQLDKYNNLNWYKEKQFYGDVVVGERADIAFAPGWCGGGIISYGMMKLGGALEYERGVKTLEFLFSIQGKSGLFLQT